jgi:hypothetical protein
MSSAAARVIQLDEFRRRRDERQTMSHSTNASTPVVWYPVWVWVALWPVA